MKKIKVLFGVLLLFTIVSTAGTIYDINLYYNLFEQDIGYRDMMPNQIHFWLKTCNSLILIFGIYLIQHSLYLMIKNDFFTPTAMTYLKNGGSVMILVSLTSFGYSLIVDVPDMPEMPEELKNIGTIITGIFSIFQAIIGFGCLIIADILSKGNDIKEDNDLTI